MNIIFRALIVCFLLNAGAVVRAAEIEKWSLPETRKPGEEFLLYRLSYRGLFTAFVWKDLADTVIIADDQPYLFNTRKSCRLHLKMSTEDFAIAETFLPMRYHWRTTVSPDLSQIYLIEEINENNDQVHKVAWLDADKKRLRIYHRRKKVVVSGDGFDDFDDEESDDGEELILEWEKDSGERMPGFLVDKPMLDSELSYFVHEKTVKFLDEDPVFDPLSLIFSARWKDYSQNGKVDFVVSYKDTFRKYRAHYKGDDVLDIGDESVAAIKVEIRRKNENSEKNDEATMMIWLSDDERRIPLQYLVDANLGELKLKLNAKNLDRYQDPVNCIKRQIDPLSTSIVKNKNISAEH